MEEKIIETAVEVGAEVVKKAPKSKDALILVGVGTGVVLTVYGGYCAGKKFVGFVKSKVKKSKAEEVVEPENGETEEPKNE